MSPSRISWWMAAELGTLVLAGALAVWLFELHPIDTDISSLFYDQAAGGWPWASVGWVKFVNDRLITLISICAGVGSLLLWVLGGRVNRNWRYVGMFLFLSLALGPGLVVNGILKAEWGRPVPRDVVGLGGHLQFRHISNPGASGPPERGGDGRSFPSGHESIAAWTSVFYLLLRPRRPRLAVAALCGTLAFGALIAFTRIAAGRHFISDVVWSMLITFLVNWLLCHAHFLRPAFSWPAAVRRRVLNA